MTRTSGATQRRRSQRFVMPLLAAMLFALLFSGNAQGMITVPIQGGVSSGIQNNGVFELDADVPPASPTNTDHTTAGLPDDWDRICHTATASSTTPLCGSALNDNASARTFVSEVAANGGATNASIFTGGGSKDPSLIADWNWKDLTGGLPDKDNLLHGAAARYSSPPGCPGCELLYFSADRFDNSGDSQIGFWFFKSGVTLNADGTFSGAHLVGDILVLSDFTNGGKQPTIAIFEWVGSGGSDGSLNLIAGSFIDVRDCAVAPANAAFCASVNPNDGQDPPWPFLNKSGQNTYGHGEFYEGGIDLGTLGFGNECFSSFLAETRSSQSVTATLKDFVLGSFQRCNAALTTTPSATVGTPVTPGTPVTDLAVIQGGGTTTPPDPTSPPNVVFSICGPISPSSATLACDGSDAAHTAATFGTSKALVHCTGAGTPAAFCTAADPPGTSRALSDAVTKTAAGVYCFTGTWAGDANYPGGASDIGTNGSECYRVKDTSSVTTAQNWLPNDTATVTTGSGATATGSVTFSLYESADCSGTAKATFGPTALVSGSASTNNTSVYTANATISWRVTFTPSDPIAVQGSTSHCETSTLTVNNDTGS